MIFILFKIQN